MVALLLFYVTSDECAEEIVVIQTSTGNRNLLHPLKNDHFSSVWIQLKVALDATG